MFAMNNPDPVYVLHGSNDPITSVDFIEAANRQSTRQLVAGTQGGELLIWDLKVG